MVHYMYTGDHFALALLLVGFTVKINTKHPHFFLKSKILDFET